MDSSCNQAPQGQTEYNVQPDQPWLLADGKITPDEHLKTLTPSWSAETWERYLTWFETPRSESLLTPWRYDQICEESTESIFEFAQSNADDDLKNRVESYLRFLTGQQRQVVEMIFWEGRSERYVAQQLGINHKSVHRLKLRALKKITQLLKGGPSSRLMRREISLLSTETGDTNGKEVLDLAEGALPQAG